MPHVRPSTLNVWTPLEQARRAQSTWGQTTSGNDKALKIIDLISYTTMWATPPIPPQYQFEHFRPGAVFQRTEDWQQGFLKDLSGDGAYHPFSNFCSLCKTPSSTKDPRCCTTVIVSATLLHSRMYWTQHLRSIMALQTCGILWTIVIGLGMHRWVQS